jgi:hypothetical protein
MLFRNLFGKLDLFPTVAFVEQVKAEEESGK